MVGKRINKSYFCFIEVNGEFDIVELLGKSTLDLENDLCELGCKVYQIFSKEKYEEYKKNGEELFVKKYVRKFGKNKIEFIKRNMFGK